MYLINTNKQTTMSSCPKTSTTSASELAASIPGYGAGGTSGFPMFQDDYGGQSLSFSAYLHNPFGYSYLTETQKQAVDLEKAKSGKIEDRLYNLLMKIFGNREINEKMGLVHQYNRLKTIVLNDKLIGMIMWGADGTNDQVEISKYTTSSGEIYTLTVQSICYRLIREYIEKE